MIAEPEQPPETDAIEILGDPKEWLKLLVLGFFAGGMQLVQHVTGTKKPTPTEASSEIMSADEVAAFLGLDRNTIYDYAGRGVIPHQRIGKRILFSRGALVSWLDSCKATSTRKG
jgi:excisionase family DNA binding protein